MKKMLLLLFAALFAASCFLTGCTKKESINGVIEEGEIEGEIKKQEGIVGDKLPVSRALAAKMIALYFYNPNEINSFERIIEFEDVKEGLWYDKYINAVYSSGFMSGTDEKNFSPNEMLSLSQAQSLVDRIDEQNKVKIKLTDENKDKPVSYALWNELFKKLMENKGNGKIGDKRLVLVASNKENSSIRQDYVITDSGLYKASGIKLNGIIGAEISALVNGDEIVGVTEILSIEPEIKNVLVTSVENGYAELFIGGIRKKFYYENLPEIKAGDIFDAKIVNGEITKITSSGDKINSTVLSVSAGEDKIELAATGALFHDECFKVYYFDSQQARMGDKNNLICGENYNFFIKDGKFCAAVIENDRLSSKMRVLINNNEGKSYNGMVKIGGSEDFDIITGRDERHFKKNDEVEIEKGKNEDLFSTDKITVRGNGGYIYLKFIKTNSKDGFFKVKGDVEIRKTDDGYIVVNDIDMEDYILGVLNGIENKNLSYEVKKVMAVILRSRAYCQKEKNNLAYFGANVDRTSTYQSYRPDIENKENEDIVNETRGMCITYNEKFINANYFDQDCGITAAAGEVWFDKDSLSFPYDAGAYNKSEIFLNGFAADLRNEENFRKFIDNGNDKDSSDLFRWSFRMNMNEISACVNASIKYLYNDYPQFVRCLDKNGKFVSKEVEDIGEVRDIEVVNRGSGGNVMQMKIIGSREIVLLSTDNVIRKIIKPKQFVYGAEKIKLHKNDGSYIEDNSVMPSGFFYVDVTKDENGNLTEAEFKGGGNGHGVGVSLDRAEKFAKGGMKFEDILLKFYSRVSIAVNDK